MINYWLNSCYLRFITTSQHMTHCPRYVNILIIKQTNVFKLKKGKLFSPALSLWPLWEKQSSRSTSQHFTSGVKTVYCPETRRMTVNRALLQIRKSELSVNDDGRALSCQMDFFFQSAAGQKAWSCRRMTSINHCHRKHPETAGTGERCVLWCEGVCRCPHALICPQCEVGSDPARWAQVERSGVEANERCQEAIYQPLTCRSACPAETATDLSV